ncbi:MAG: anaerobic ribonucleoside-triphosphate reductase [bacterium]|nr:anaerobic ribonucleoside-triphosphate reductase [bacterium]
MVNVQNVKAEKISCHDCKKEITTKGKEINNGVLLKYDDGGEMIEIFKCQNCYEKSPSLQNFRHCEVYSRIVGYLRPVQQWNNGKQQEFKERKMYRA